MAKEPNRNRSKRGTRSRTSRLPVGWIVLGVWVIMFAGIAMMLGALWSSWQTAVEREPVTPDETPVETTDTTDER